MAATQLSSGSVLDSDPQALFASIYEKFKDALPPGIQKDFAGFKSPSEMLQNFNRLVEDSKSRSGMAGRSLKVTAKLAEKLGPYFEVINIYVQSHPEYAALVWGTLRFIFLVATNYTTFLTKIETMLFRMTNTMPNFQLFLSKLQENKVVTAAEVVPRLTQALAYIYSDILSFCHRLCTLLHPEQKGIRSRWKRFNNMAFKPFDAHFAEILEKFELHSELFMDLMNTTSAVAALEFYDRWKVHMMHVQLSLDQMQNQQQSQEKENDKILMNAAIVDLQRRVGAPMWATTFEHARSHRVDESGEWLLAHPLVAGLIEDSSAATARRPNVLFLYGKPGYGKTTLATVVIDHLRDTASLRGKNGPGSLAFFFFDRQGRFNSSHDAFRALLAQLIFCRRFDRIVLDIAAITRSDHDTGQQLASDDEVFAILHLFLLQFSNCAFVCDGVDECKDRDNFLKRLSRLAADHEECQFILLSRPIIKIPREFRKRCNILEMDHTQNIEDLTNFVRPQVEDLVEGGELVLLGATSVDDLTSSICTRSNGMFLWAALFLGYLKLPSLSISQRREALEDSHKFEGLFSLYDGILEFIEKEYPRLSRRNIRRALSWVVGAFRPLQVDELQAAIAQMDDKPFDEADTIPNFEESIGPMTGALIEITKDKAVRLIHITVAEYLVSNSETIRPSFRDESILDFKQAVVQVYLTTTCLAYMVHTVPIGPYADRYSKDTDFASTRKEYPLFAYAAQSWTSHLREVTDQFATSSYVDSLCIFEELGQRAILFLSNKLKFTSWTEALWHMSCPQEAWAMESVDWKRIDSIYNDSEIKTAASLLHLAFEEHRGLVKSWGNVLQKYPEELWQPSISAFSESMLRKTTTAAETTSILHNSTGGQDSTVLQTKCSSSGHAIGILRAQYQSNVTHYMYQSDNPTDLSPITVTYEIRSLNDDQLLFETTLEVPRRDVYITSRKRTPDSFHQKQDSFSIETSISTTLMEVIVGCTLMKLAVSMEASGPQFQCTKHTLGFLTDNSGFQRPHSSGSLWKLFLSPGAEYLLLLRNATQPESGSVKGKPFCVDIFQDPRCHRSPMEPRFAWVAWKTIANTPTFSKDANTDTKFGSDDDDDDDNDDDDDDGYEDGYERKTEDFQNQPFDRSLDTTTPSPDKIALELLGDTNLPPILAYWPNGSSSQPIIDTDLDNELPENVNRRSHEPILHFHPTFPQIVYSSSTGTYLWNFCSLLHSTVHAIHQDHVKIHTSALSNIRIADSGNLLYGLERVEGKERVAILSLEPYQEIFGKPRIVPVNSQTLNSAKSVVQYLGKFKRADLLREASSNAQPSGTAMLVLDPTGRPAISILRQSRDDGSLVQETFDSEGNAKAQTIVHLPRSIPNNTEVTLLNPGASSTQHSSKRVKVLLGVRPKSSYSFQEACNVSTAKECLPTMFQRHKSSIRTIEGKIQHLVKDYSSSQPTTLLNEEQSHTAGSVKEGGDDDSY